MSKMNLFNVIHKMPGLFCVFLSVVILSCKDDDPIYVDYATLFKSGGNDYKVITDRQEELLLQNDNLSLNLSRDTTRALVYYEIKKELSDALQVKLVGIDTILTKSIMPYADSLLIRVGQDPIAITKAWITNNFLTIEFRYNSCGCPSGTKHLISLLQKEDKDGKLQFELCHNAFRERQVVVQAGIVSFKLNNILLDQITTKDLVINYKISEGVDDRIVIPAQIK